MKVFLFLTILGLAALATANCGCLKCSKNLRVVSDPCSPIKVIYRDAMPDCPCLKPLPYDVQIPVIKPNLNCLPTAKLFGYRVELPEAPQVVEEETPCFYDYTVQTPIIPPKLDCLPSLKTYTYCADRVVLPAPVSVCKNVENEPQQEQEIVFVNKKNCRPPLPILETIRRPSCGCRYISQHSRLKRDAPLLQHSMNFMVGLLPSFIKKPIQQTVRMMNYHQNPKKKAARTSNLFKQQDVSRKYHPVEVLKSAKAAFDYKDFNLKKPIVKDNDLNKESFNFMKSLNDEEMARKKLLGFLNLEPERKVKMPLTLREKAVLMEKLKKINEPSKRRSKRSIIIGSDELSLPFFEVKDVSEEEEEEESSEEEYEELVAAPKYNYLKRLDFQERHKQRLEDYHNKYMERHPILYLIKAPITLMKQLHEIKETVDPVLKTGAELLGSSKQYFKDFHKNLHSGVLNLASNVIGDFDNLHPKPNHFNNMMKPLRFRRSLPKQFEPEYTIAFNNSQEENFRIAPQPKVRKRRYILKVVDEKEVQEFLREKLGNLIDGSKEKVEKKAKKKHDKKEIVGTAEATPKKIVLEKLKPRIIIDNNGIPFMEMNGVKRPLALKHKHKKREEIVGQEQEEEIEEEEEEEVLQESSEEKEKTADKLSELIDLAREKVEKGEPVIKSRHQEMPVHTIKEKITQDLGEVENLINMDFMKYSNIYDDLLHCQNIKDSIVEDWKKILMERKINDISYKLGLLDKFKELQDTKDECVKEIANILTNENKFMTKHLIIMMIRLQKLQCITSRVVDDFSERMQMDREFNVQNEIKYVDLMNSINLVQGRTRNDNINLLKKARDETLQEEMKLLDNLRKLLEKRDTEIITEEAGIIWEMKNIEKLQKDTITEMNNRIEMSQKIKKELKILFDLQKQWDSCDIQQKTLLIRVNASYTECENSKKPPVNNYKNVLIDKYKNYLVMAKNKQRKKL